MNSESFDPREPATGEPPDTGASRSGLTAEEQLSKAKEEAQKFRDNWHRAEADFQNYKRRTEQEREELRRFGNVSIIINLLPVLDDFERAIKTESSDKEYSKGMEMIYQRFYDSLKKLGLEPIVSVGQPFDPHVHHAGAVLRCAIGFGLPITHRPRHERLSGRRVLVEDLDRVPRTVIVGGAAAEQDA